MRPRRRLGNSIQLSSVYYATPNSGCQTEFLRFLYETLFQSSLPLLYSSFELPLTSSWDVLEEMTLSDSRILCDASDRMFMM